MTWIVVRFVQKKYHRTTYTFSKNTFMKSGRMLKFNDIFPFVVKKREKEFSVY